MIGLIIMVAIQGFMLAWIAQLIAHEEVEVKTGAIIVVLTAAVSTIAGLLLREVLGIWLVAAAQLALYFGVLCLLLKAMAHLQWKHSAVIAAIYTALYLALLVGVIMLLSS